MSQIDITDPAVSVEQLYKLALEQQKAVTSLLAQLQQAQANVQAIEAEIQRRCERIPQIGEEKGEEK